MGSKEREGDERHLLAPSFAPCLTSLKANFSNCFKLTDLSPLGQLTGLTSLDADFMHCSKLTDLSPLGQLTGLTSLDADIRNFWIEHGKRCREISAHMGKELSSPCVTNVWIPDGFKDIPVDRARHRAIGGNPDCRRR